MQVLARFAMRGRSQAALVAATTAVLSVLPVIGLLAALISAGVIALATLRHGPSEGLLVAGLAGLGGGVLAWLALGSPLPAIGFLLIFWFPVWLLAVALGWSRSLSVTVQAAAGLAVLGLVLVYAIAGGVRDPWIEILEPLRLALVEAAVLGEADSVAAIERVAAWMPGLLTATVYLMVVSSLLIGRWWQALLYNPGGFGAEFRALRIHPLLGVVTVAVYLLVVFLGEAHWAIALLLILGPLLVLQGLAVVHALAYARQTHVGWLAGLYVLFVLGFPLPQMIVAGLGLADIWVDLRSRFSGRDDERP
ncbi:hypothetical protein ABC977_06670 [Thioalkalicoccus limnaeus]|uniref:DUF2232 domain-containing protein n=1 Tax=Thioalkalicoccus limnaeus TaxID=120681 RepID=A0ABV4BC63_9GAMM